MRNLLLESAAPFVLSARSATLYVDTIPYPAPASPAQIFAEDDEAPERRLPEPPTDSQDVARESQESTASSPASASPANRSPGHVLVVDDEGPIREAIRAVLEDEDYSVAEAVDGIAALATLRASERSLVVLLDYAMPRMNGWELLQAALADPLLAGRHAFVLVTANLHATQEDFVAFLTRHNIDVVQKPFDVITLLMAVEQAAQRLLTS